MSIILKYTTSFYNCNILGHRCPSYRCTCQIRILYPGKRAQVTHSHPWPFTGQPGCTYKGFED